MILEPRERNATPSVWINGSLGQGKATSSRPVVVVGLGVVVSLVLIGFAAAAGNALFGGSQGDTRTQSALFATGDQSLRAQSELVEQRRAAIVAYGAQVADFDALVSRRPGTLGVDALGLDAGETKRHEDILTSLTLECIDAVDHYNLEAQAVGASAIRSVGLPERFTWAVDCASEQ